MCRIARAAALILAVFAVAGCAASSNIKPGSGTGTDAGDAGTDGTVNYEGGLPDGPDLGDSGMTCTPKTCADLGVDCGIQSDGCGHTIDCGGCTAPDYCGGAGPSKCGTGPCVKKTCADLNASCGTQGDGCGGLLDCGTCPAPQTCGGGGTPNQCGGGCTPKTCADMPAGTCGPVADGCGGITADCGGCPAGQACGGGGVPNMCGAPPCTPKTCADYPAGTCGKQADGCGGLTADCGTCTLPDICGGGGVANQCGNNTSKCTPKTCADFPSGTCGRQSDGCGGLTANCGGCTAPACCGCGGTPNVCGGAPPPCVPKTCAQLGANCGRASDGCGGLTANCGGCTSPQCCGCGGTPNVCGGAPLCTPKTCADFPSGTCGKQSDGCGGLTADCGSCPTGQYCGGGGPNLCGNSSTCINLQCQQVQCTTGTTSISGTVYDPAGLRPLPNVYVYVPNGTPAPFTDGATCDKCSAALTGLPLVTTLTGTDGKFKLDNMPVGNNIPVVIQLGRWRRQITVSTQRCVDTAVAATLTHLPQNQSQGDIPKIALSTGGADSLECLLRKIGISDSEFTNPGGGGRVTLFAGQPQKGRGQAAQKYDAALGGASFPDSTTLWASASSLQKYNVVLLSCEGYTYPSTKPASALQAMYNYVNEGGRVFASHYHYYWLQNGPSPWSSIASWNSDLIYPYNSTEQATENIVQSFPKGADMAQWLLNVGGSTTLGTLSVNYPRDSVTDGTFDSSLAREWIYVGGISSQYPPYWVDANLGRFVDINHVPQYFSFNAPIGAASDQQCGRFVFSDIHVSSGDTGTTFPDECQSTGMTPQELALEYMFFDLSSPICDETQPPPTCTPLTCADQGIQCGPAPDGCGGVISSCGTCPSGQVCGAGGKCSSSSCTPTTCAALGKNCGTWSDGCGNTLNCGSCTTPQTCGGGGTPGVCGSGSCTPTTCAQLSKNCGSWSDGCGNILNCGTCTAPETCGGGGTPGQCGAATCTPKTCAQLGISCGQAGDGCGGVLDCGPCSGPTCTPKTCAQLGVTCGLSGNGCGGTIDCGACTPTCTPLTCGGRCGKQGDGCGGILDCTPCPPGSCTPTTCSNAAAQCGFYPDGCGGSLQCGTCPTGSVCNNNQCVPIQ